MDREIPAAIKKAVRQRCGFGCVVCGSAIYEYEHFDPEFKDAKIHNANGIALLCPNDHRRKEKKLLSKDEYIRQIKAPYAISRGFSSTEWSLASFAPEILIGSFTFTGGTSILQIGDKIFLGFSPPEAHDTPPKLSFAFQDRNGIEVFRLVGNEIQCGSDAFDIEAIGDTWTIRSKMYHIDLVIKFDPPTRITIEKLHFRHLKWELKAEIGKFELWFDDQPIQTIAGVAKICGPVFLKLGEHEPHVEMANSKIVFGAGPAPIGTTPSENGFVLTWPVYCRIDPKTNLPEFVALADNYKVLAIYTVKEIARKNAKKDLQIMPLSKEQLCNLVRQYQSCGYINSVSFNPNKEMACVYLCQDFMQNLQCVEPKNIESENDISISRCQDKRPTVIQFPLYVLIDAQPDTPIHEVEFAVVQGRVETLPVFTNSKSAEIVRCQYKTKFELHKLGPKRFIKFLESIVLPRQVRYLCFDPQPEASEELVTEFIEIGTFLDEISFDTPPEEVERQIESGNFKKL